MGGKGSGRPQGTDALIKQETHKVLPIARENQGEFILPNQSGDHSAGNVRRVPENELDLVNKNYVDGLIRGNVVLFLTEDASDIGTYFDLTIDTTGNPEENTITAIPGNSTALISAYASILNETEIEAITDLELGIYSMHIHASANFPAGMTIYFEFYRRTAGGTETFACSSS